MSPVQSDPTFCAEVARKVLGAVPLRRGEPIPQIYTMFYLGRLILHPNESASESRYFRPDVDLNDAMLVIEKLAELGYHYSSAQHNLQTGEMTAQFCNGNITDSGEARGPLPLAICRAALRTVQSTTEMEGKL